MSYDSGNNLCLSYVEPCCEYYNEDRTVVQLARRAFSVAAPSTWNSLPADIRLCENILTFKRHLKTHIFKLTLSSCAASSASVSSDLKALYKSVIIII